MADTQGSGKGKKHPTTKRNNNDTTTFPPQHLLRIIRPDHGLDAVAGYRHTKRFLVEEVLRVTQRTTR